MDSQYTRHIHVVISCVMQQVTYDVLVLSKSLHFCLHLLNGAHVVSIHTIFEAIPNKLKTGIRVGRNIQRSINK
jgi:hypothetical protein